MKDRILESAERLRLEMAKEMQRMEEQGRRASNTHGGTAAHRRRLSREEPRRSLRASVSEASYVEC